MIKLTELHSQRLEEQRKERVKQRHSSIVEVFSKLDREDLKEFVGRYGVKLLRKYVNEFLKEDGKGIRLTEKEIREFLQEIGVEVVEKEKRSRKKPKEE